MPNVNVTYTIVNCRPAREFTNVNTGHPRSPREPKKHRAQDTRHDPSRPRETREGKRLHGLGAMRAKRCREEARTAPSPRRRLPTRGTPRKARGGARGLGYGLCRAPAGFLDYQAEQRKRENLLSRLRAWCFSHFKKGMCQNVNPCSYKIASI